MKRFAIFLSVTVLSLTGVQVAHAQETTPMTESHIERIKTNCTDAQSRLIQLHANDAWVRVNRGQLYESISTKLMATLNSRIVLNKMDSGKLVVITTDYERELTLFRQNYIQYEESLSRLLKMNCKNQPVAFYDGVAEARTLRKKVSESTQRLKVIIGQYRDEFEQFAATVMESAS